MKNRSESGVTMVMLVITIIVMLIIASIVTFYTIQNNGLLTNATDTQFIQRIKDIKDEIEEKEALKQDLAGDVNVTLSQEELAGILGEYINDFTVTKEQDEVDGKTKSVIKYRNNSTNFTTRQKRLMESKLDIRGTN